MIQCDELSCMCTANAKSIIWVCGQKINNNAQKKRTSWDSNLFVVTVVHTRIILLGQKRTVANRLHPFVYKGFRGFLIFLKFFFTVLWKRLDASFFSTHPYRHKFVNLCRTTFLIFHGFVLYSSSQDWH